MNRSCCIRDYCGKPFDPSEPETRDRSLLRAFWYRYCPEHRISPTVQTPITEVRAEWFAKGKHVRYRLPGFTTSELAATCDTAETALVMSASRELLESAKDALESLKRLPDVDGAYRVTVIQELEKAISKAEGKD